MDSNKIVNLIFISAGLITGFIIHQICLDIFDYYQIYVRFEYARQFPQILGILAGGGLAVLGIYNDKINTWMTEVVGELKKVTWPTRKETSAATVVVIITLLIMAVILYAFDLIWGTLIHKIIS